MRTYSLTGAVLVVIAALAAGQPARAGDAPEFSSATDAYRGGLAALREGQAEAGLRALEYAAERGILGAQLRLARIYAMGDGAPRSEAKAFRFYQRIADQYADASTLYPVGRYVAEAFVAVGRYHLTGIEEIGLRSDPARAADMFRHAASYFGDANAQYQLARLYLQGAGVHKNARLAVNWLANAAKKHHAAAQALLGDILWRGHQDVRRQPHKGLALLALARENATGTEAAAWIEPLYQAALAEATDEDREGANAVLAHWPYPVRGDADIVISIEADALEGAGRQAQPRSSQDASGAPVVPSVAVNPAVPITPSASKGTSSATR